MERVVHLLRELQLGRILCKCIGGLDIYVLRLSTICRPKYLDIVGRAYYR